MSDDYTPEVYTLANRVAAAFMRGDPGVARELINDARLKWEAEGRDQQRRAVEKFRDAEAATHRKANAYFETKDGMRVPGEVSVDGHWPYVWKRACRDRTFVLTVGPQDFGPIEVRTYELSHERARDGRPVYVEV